jgi:hypothetical protein
MSWRILSSLLLLAPPLLHACSCVSIAGPCDRGWNLGEAIFLGKNVAMEKVAKPDGNPAVSYAAHFTIEESFRGVGAPGSEVVVDTGGGGGDCGYPFVPGNSYLVYASMNSGHLYTGTCTETRPRVMVEGVLSELRALRDHARADDVFGTVVAAPKGVRFEDLTGAEPLAGVPVRATASGGASFSTMTNDRGVYVFPALPAGTNKIEADLPAGFARPAPPYVAEVNPGGLACRVDTFARPDGRIAGTVVDFAGRPVAGFVTIEPADPVEAAAARTRGGLPGDDAGPNGKFSLPQLPPGRYLLVFHPREGGHVNFRTTFHFPSDPSDAIDVALGQKINGLLFKVGITP